MNEIYQKMCRAIFKSENVEKAVLNVLIISNPGYVVTAAAMVVHAETRDMRVTLTEEGPLQHYVLHLG